MAQQFPAGGRVLLGLVIFRPPLPMALSLILAVAAGLLVGAGQAPMGVWPATIAGVALFTWLVAGLRPWPALGLGYVSGLAMNTLTVSWVSVLGVWVSVALIAFMALWWALLAVTVSRLMLLRAWPVLVPAAWVAMEYASGKIPFGGFAWTRLAYTAIDQPMSGYLGLVGLAGVGYLVGLVANLLLLAVLSRRFRPVSIAATASIVAVGGLANLAPPAPASGEVTVAMVQPNVNRAEKGTATYAQSVTNNAVSETVFALAAARTSGAAPDFVLWPENATDVDPMADRATRTLVELAVGLADVPIFVGAVTDGPVPDSRQTTSIWWDPVAGPGERYHKRNLVPFGEYIPFRDVLLPRLPILSQVGRQSIPGVEPGVVTAPTDRYPDLKVGTLICFELAYDETSYDLVRNGAEVIVSQSNTNTYAGTFEPHQQLVINRARAMELGREVAASALNSTSAVIDARGRVLDVAGEFEAASFIVTMPVRTNVTPAVRLGPWPALAALIVTMAGLAAGLRRPGAAAE